MAGRIGKRLIIALAGCVALSGMGPARGATPEEVDKTLKNAVNFLYSQQKGDSWDPPTPGEGHAGQQWGGISSIAVYALLAAGEKPQASPKLAAGIEWLKKAKVTGTYAVGLRAQIWNLIPKDESVRDAIKRDALTLLEGAKTGNNFDGMWHYTPRDGGYDHSTAQYGTLGMWALERAGLELPDALWKATEEQWQKDQIRDGTWGYSKGAVPAESPTRTVNMTAAGIATLFITQDYLRSNDGIKCSGNIENTAIDKGMKWMEKNLPELIGKRQVQPYGWYGIERIGVASGYKYFGTVDWYDAGADYIVKEFAKSKNGSIGNSIPNTAFCMLFLARGRAPVVMNKLQYKLDAKEVGNWNQRPRDAANAVKYMMKQMERDLNWQIVNLGVATNELHDSPILYIAGNQPLKFTSEEEGKLKQFVQQGGIILGHADCGEKKFADSFKALGTKLFKYEFRALEKEHPIYTRQQFLYKNWKTKPDLLGMTNGVREMMLLIPTSDPGKAWQLRDDRSKEEQFQLMNNIFLYGVEGRDLKFKGHTHIVEADKKTPKSTIKVARLQIGDNPDPEPGGWKRLAAVMTNQNQVGLEAVNVKAEEGALKDFKVAHLTGTTKVTLKPAEQAVLKAFIDAGGTLVIDAAGGETEFATSIEAELGKTFGNQPLESIPFADPMFAGTGTKLAEVAFRPFARTRLPGGQSTPTLRGLKFGERYGVILSREDLSGGLVGQSVDGIVGYTPASATDVMRTIVMYAGGVKPAAAGSGATTKPATMPAKAPATEPAKKDEPAKTAASTTAPAESDK